jgi:orotate phosphoribosyltransferase
LIIRKQAKGHGTAAWIEGGELSPGAEIVVLEDVVTTGASALFAVEKLHQAGYRVTEIITLVDRNQGGAETFAKAGMAFRSVFAIAEIKQYAAQMS